jgi:peroxiredoxin
MTIKTGDRLPEARFMVMTPSGPTPKTGEEIFSGKRVVLFAVPGAFTPTCHLKHLPGFLNNVSEFKAKGVDTIACTAVNDVFVMDAWAKTTGAQNDILFLADGSGDFAKAIGMDLDASAGGLGIRSQRYAMLVEDAVVKMVNLEDVPSEANQSSAEVLLGAL